MSPEPYQDLNEATQRFNDLAEAVPLACLLINASNAEVLAANARALRLLPANIVGKAITEQAIDPQKLNDSLNQFSNSRSATSGRWQLQAVPTANSEASLDLHVTGALFAADSGNNATTLFITLVNQTANNDRPLNTPDGSVTEIEHERHQLQRDNQLLESEVLKRTKKLELRNEELDLLNQSLNDFVSIVSHDLAASTRRIQSFATLLQRELPDDLATGSIRNFLAFLVESAERLTQMIDGSVRLSCIRPSSELWRPIDIEKVLNLVAADVRAMDVTAHFTLNHQKLHKPYADAGLIEQLLQNLLNNSVKFRRADTPLVIEVSSSISRELDYVEIAITDNGQGIGKHDLTRVMRPFSRGAGVQDISGTGMGLAMCVRICQQHQGRLWIARSGTGKDGEPAGTEIRFRLPASEPRAAL